MSDDDNSGGLSVVRLRIVTNNKKPIPEAHKPNLSRIERRRFAQIPLTWLRDPTWQKKIAPDLRLYLLLQYATKRGSRSVRLTTEMLADVGIARQNKHRYLTQLEASGLVKVVRDGRRLPEVSLPPVIKL
jgi:hypothetical protein